MAQPTQIIFSYKEAVEALVKKQGLHEGLWSLYIRFGLKATNLGENDNSLAPTAIIPLMEIGLQRTEKLNNLSVDAAIVNPLPASHTIDRKQKLK
jgi:hypothetical protein